VQLSPTSDVRSVSASELNPSLDLNVHDLMMRATARSRDRTMLRDFLAIESMAGYIKIACSPLRASNVCYGFADDLICQLSTMFSSAD